MEPFAEYVEHDGLGLAELVSTGEVHPLELVEAAIERVESWNPHINAVVHRMYDRARAVASAESLPGGPFKGVPMLLKDLHAAYAGEPLTSSCRFLSTHVPDYDGETVKRLKAAGMIIVGKTNAPELGILGVTEPALRGPCRNPWNLDHTPGGSSGGAGAAVAAGIVPIGHGGDGGGSIRIPASCTGIFGLKPTRGRMPTGPDVGESWCGLDSDCFLSRSVRDGAAILDACHGADLGAPYASPPVDRPFLKEVGQDPGKLRIAWTGQSLLGEKTDPDCQAALDDAISLLTELGHEVDEAHPPYDKPAMARAYLLVVAASVAHDIAKAEELMGRPADPEQFEPATWLLGQIGGKASAADLLHVLEARHLTWRKIAEFMESYDLLLTPTMAYPPQRIGEGAPKPAEAMAMRVLRSFPLRAALDKVLDEMGGAALEKVSNTMLFNMTGQPAMSMPLYWAESGLPIGVQLVGRFGAEATLLRVAAQLEEARPWADRRPTLPEKD